MAASNSTYVQDGTGTYIPATQRPDGTWRKARRVKDGYIPQDEMPLYESKGKQWAKNKPSLPIGMDPNSITPLTIAYAANTTKTIPGLTIADCIITKSSKKKKKKKSENRKTDDLLNQLEDLNISPSQALKKEPCAQSSENGIQISPQVATDPAKRIRNLKKKLRDINALQQKIDSGELINPEKDQLEKIARKEEIEAEIEDLELDIEIA